MVFRKAAESRHPRKVALHDPAPAKQHEATLGLRLSNHLQHDAVVVGVVLGLLAGIAVVDLRELDVPTGGTLLGLRRASQWGTVLLVCRHPVQRQLVAEGVDGNVHLRPLPALHAIASVAVAALWRVPERPASHDRDRRLRAEVGVDPQEPRRSRTMDSKTPTRIQRRTCW